VVDPPHRVHIGPLAITDEHTYANVAAADWRPDDDSNIADRCSDNGSTDALADGNYTQPNARPDFDDGTTHAHAYASSDGV